MTQSCRAKRRRWSELRHSATTARSAGVRLQCRASSSSLGSTGIGSRRRACGAAAWGSSVDIEVRTLQIGREVVARWSRIDDGRVQRIMAKQARELDQLAGIVAQVAERESVAQRVRRDRDPLEAGASSEAGDDGLDGAHRHRRLSAADEQRRVLARRLAAVEMLLERAPPGGVQRNLPRLEALAVTDA